MKTAGEPRANESAPAPAAPLSVRANRWLENLAGLVLGVCMLGALFACYGITSPRMPDLALVAALALLVAVATTAVALHEFGHYLGARWGRMTVMAVAVGPLELVAVVGGWRLRRRRRKRLNEAGGYVIAYPDPERRSRRDYVLMLLGGPLANLVAAAILAAALAGMTSSPWQLACIAIALMNFAGFACNLLPYRTKTLFTDGLQLLYLRQPQSGSDPMAVWGRLVGRSLRGDTAEELPEEELRVLAEHPEQLPLLYEWFQLKSSQNLGLWPRAADIERAVDRRVAIVSDELLAHLSQGMLPLLRAEIAFSRSMASGDAAYVEAIGVPPDLQRDAPHLMPRLRALAAGLRGDCRRADVELEASRRAAETSIEVALRRSEARLRTYLQAIIAAHACVRGTTA